MKDFDREYMLDQLEKLLAIDSTSGQFREMQDYIQAEMERLGFEPKTLRKGGIWCDLGGEGNSLCLLSHLDDIGLMVRHIYPDGTLKVVPIGGLRACAAEHENVRVYSRGGVYSGTVQRINSCVHVTPADVYNAAADYDKNICIVLDADVHSAEDTRALGIRTGDIIALDPHFTMAGDFIKSRFIDDKGSAACLLTVLKILHYQNLRPQYNTVFFFSVYEETGHGASYLPAGVSELLAVDMGCIGDDLSCTEYDVSICAKDSHGPYDYEMVSRLVRLAQERELDYAVDIYPRYGSDVGAAWSAGNDVKGALIGPGVHASHGMERTHYKGMENTIKLILAYLGC